MLKNLKNLRKSAGVSQAELAKAIGTTQQNINKYENTDCNPSIEILTRLADYFHTSIDYLVGHCDDEYSVKDAFSPGLSENELRVMEEYRRMPEFQQNVLYQAIRIAEQDNNNHK